MKNEDHHLHVRTKEFTDRNSEARDNNDILYVYIYNIVHKCINHRNVINPLFVRGSGRGGGRISVSLALIRMRTQQNQVTIPCSNANRSENRKNGVKLRDVSTENVRVGR